MDARRHVMRAGDLAATFLPERGMLGISLTHRGDEILQLVDDLDAAADAGRSVGIPINHPWANRLSGPRYSAAGRDVQLDPENPLLLKDWNGTIIHGLPWSKLDWTQQHADETSLTSELDWSRPDLLEVFPYPHRLLMRASLQPDALAVETTLIATGDTPVPVSFGFHPYIAVPGLARQQWRIELPEMQSIVLDELLLPTGRRERFPALDEALAEREFDDGFALGGEGITMAISGNGRRVAVEFVRGFPYAQIYGPAAHDHISFEPMTAPADALTTGEDLRLVAPGESFTGEFRIRVSDL
ncbi:aldose 1-epimerase [Cognatilysobacter bugurensis]|uniref:Aldose 1-epimerase n=1 Tax=Cognatilysobacter bugurensis TaxID=543356 RepID=A0A918SWC6_9GAMM|nr:aldose 1-epimerase [Lysobacter bugurensis]GHA74878.1 aldose 1-epimerase [Lysobacter bugurensis]